VLIGILQPAIVLFLVRIRLGAGRRVARGPEGADEALPLGIRMQRKKLLPLFRLDDVRNLFVQPVPVKLGKLLLRLVHAGSSRGDDTNGEEESEEQGEEAKTKQQNSLELPGKTRQPG